MSHGYTEMYSTKDEKQNLTRRAYLYFDSLSLKAFYSGLELRGGLGLALENFPIDILMEVLFAGGGGGGGGGRM